RIAQSQQLIYIKFPTLTDSYAPASNWDQYKGPPGVSVQLFSRLTGEPQRGASANTRIPGRLDVQYVPSRSSGQDITLERPLDSNVNHQAYFKAILACFKYDLPVVVIREIYGPGNSLIVTVKYRECKFVEWSLGDADVGDESAVVMETIRLRCAFFEEVRPKS
ncbi:MAG: hypothetical protein C4321_09900, partial [Chloroflexota bacterium]